MKGEKVKKGKEKGEGGGMIEIHDIYTPDWPFNAIAQEYWFNFRRKARREPEVESDQNEAAGAPGAADQHSEDLAKEGQDDEHDAHERAQRHSTGDAQYDKAAQVQPTKTDKDDIEPSLSETRCTWTKNLWFYTVI